MPTLVSVLTLTLFAIFQLLEASIETVDVSFVTKLLYVSIITRL